MYQIAGIKQELSESPVSNVTSQSSSTPEKWPLLLFCSQQVVDDAELVCSVPSKRSVESLIDLFASDSSIATVVSLVHLPRLRQEHEEFWREPSGASLAWLAMLYVTMALALQRAISMDMELDDFPLLEASSRLYVTRCVQCLLKSDYTKPQTYTVEAMVSRYVTCIISLTYC